MVQITFYLPEVIYLSYARLAFLSLEYNHCVQGIMVTEGLLELTSCSNQNQIPAQNK